MQRPHELLAPDRLRKCDALSLEPAIWLWSCVQSDAVAAATTCSPGFSLANTTLYCFLPASTLHPVLPLQARQLDAKAARGIGESALGETRLLPLQAHPQLIHFSVAGTGLYALAP